MAQMLEQPRALRVSGSEQLALSANIELLAVGLESHRLLSRVQSEQAQSGATLKHCTPAPHAGWLPWRTGRSSWWSCASGRWRMPGQREMKRWHDCARRQRRCRARQLGRRPRSSQVGQIYKEVGAKQVHRDGCVSVPAVPRSFFGASKWPSCLPALRPACLPAGHDSSTYAFALVLLCLSRV